MLKYIYSILCLLIVTIAFGQAEKDVLKVYYPKPTEPGGVLVIKNNAAINTSYTGLAHIDKNLAITQETRFRMASVSKQFTAVAVYILIQDGKLSFETSVKAIFPELPDKYEPIRIKHLLNHSSGLIDYENIIPKTQKTQLSDVDVLNLIKDKDSVYFDAGENFRYSNTAYCLLSLVVERIANQSYEAFCQERIFQMLKMKSAKISAPGTFEHRAFGYRPLTNEYKLADQSITSATKGDGGVYISANDYSIWMDNGNPLYTVRFFEDLEKYSMEVKDGVLYGMGLFFTKSDDGQLTLFHSGESTGFHNIFLFEPQRNVGIALFTNRNDLKIANIMEDVMHNENIGFENIQDSLFLWLNKVYNGQ